MNLSAQSLLNLLWDVKNGDKTEMEAATAELQRREKLANSVQDILSRSLNIKKEQLQYARADLERSQAKLHDAQQDLKVLAPPLADLASVKDQLARTEAARQRWADSHYKQWQGLQGFRKLVKQLRRDVERATDEVRRLKGQRSEQLKDLKYTHTCNDNQFNTIIAQEKDLREFRARGERQSNTIASLESKLNKAKDYESLLD